MRWLEPFPLYVSFAAVTSQLRFLIRRARQRREPGLRAQREAEGGPRDWLLPRAAARWPNAARGVRGRP